MGKQVERVFPKNSLKQNTATHNASWYTGINVFLEPSPNKGGLYYKGPTLQKIILAFCIPPLIYFLLSAFCQ